jgi:transposase-like protein
LERQGVARRYRMVEGERLQQAIRDYQGGRSIFSIAKEMGVAGDTVRKALNRAGVRLRPRPGWRY